ncbi:MAG: TatD family hydrolase [Verrucomicrobia bacterium]|nr:TatD family hydrolase [Verrucomicrobiota bacterium]
MIDSHAHLTSDAVLPIVDAVIQRANLVGVEKIVNICTDEKSLKEGLLVAKKHKGVYNTAATTPHDVETEGALFFPLVEAAVSELVAIGETGLDYFYEHSPKKQQQHYLSRYFELARKVDLPVVFHCRDAFDDLFAMADEQFRDRPALLHCFTGTIDEARRCLDRGWFISFSGIITFKKSDALREVVKFVPLDRLFVETDTPYLAPHSKRGEQNEPAFVIETAAKVAELKGTSLEVVEKVTSENISGFFSLNKV